MLTSDNIFHYGNCSKCGCMQNDVRVTLSHLFLPHMCEQISDYNICCKGCSKARDKETHMIEQGIFSISVLLKYNWITSGSTRGCFMLTAPRQ